MKKILIISYYWPPGSGPGVQRILNFCNHLALHDWEPTVLTVENGIYPAMDESLLEKVNGKITIIRTSEKNPIRLYQLFKGKKNFRGTVAGIGIKRKGLLSKLAIFIRANFYIPDVRKSWNKGAINKGIEIIEKEGIQIVLTSGPPHSTHLIGVELKRKCNVKLIVDFRDPWTNISYNLEWPRTQRTKTKDARLENLVASACDHFITVSQGIITEFENRVRNSTLIYNGYNEEDFVNNSSSNEKDKFIISYVGNFKANQNHSVLWEQISALGYEIADFNTHVKLHFLGNQDSSIKQSIEEFNLGHITEFTGFVSHHDAVRAMVTSDLLLFIVPNVTGNTSIVTSKLFEYLASETDILAIGPIQGNASEVLNTSQRPPMIDYEDAVGIREAIRTSYVFWKTHNHTSRKFELTERSKQFSRARQSDKLLDVLTKL